jgi:hypothetical protein
MKKKKLEKVITNKKDVKDIIKEASAINTEKVAEEAKRVTTVRVIEIEPSTEVISLCVLSKRN